MCNQPTQCTEAASPALPTEWQWAPVISGTTYKRHTDPLGPDSQPVLRSAPTWWQVPFCQPQGGTLRPSGRWCLRELELSVQLEPEASKDSPSRNSGGMCSPTWSQLGELRWTGSLHSSSSARGGRGWLAVPEVSNRPPTCLAALRRTLSLTLQPLPLKRDRWHAHARGVRFPGSGIPGCLLHQPHC